MSHRALRKKLGGSKNPLDQFVIPPAENSESEDELLKLSAANEKSKKNKKKKNKSFNFAALALEEEELSAQISENEEINTILKETEFESKPSPPNPFDLVSFFISHSLKPGAGIQFFSFHQPTKRV